MSGELCDCPTCTARRSNPEAHPITVVVPPNLEALVQQARERLEVLTGTDLRAGDLLVALIERGARALVGAQSTDRDDRKLWEISVAELADQLGVVDLQAAREAARKARDAQEKLAQSAMAIFHDTEGLRMVAMAHRYTTPEEIETAAAKLTNTMKHHPNVAIVLAVGYVDPTQPGAPVQPVVTGGLN